LMFKEERVSNQMIHEMAEIEKVLQKWEDHANSQWDYFFDKTPDVLMRWHYAGMRDGIHLIRKDLERICEKEEKEMVSARRLSEVIEAPDGWYRIKSNVMGPTGFLGER
jgi:hypothetical protein